jgi:hypothetical protein
MSFDLKKFTSKEGVSYVVRNGQRIAVKTLEHPPEVQAKIRKRKKRQEEAFAMIPLWWARRAGEDGGLMELLVCVDLLHRAWKAQDKSFVMPNPKRVDPKVKYRVLRALEVASLITVKWRRGRSPLVTMLDLDLAQMG